MVVLPEIRFAILALVSALMPSSAISSAAARTRRCRRSSASTLAGMVLVHLRGTAANLDGQLDQTAHDQAGQVAERLVADDVDAVDVPGQRADGVPGLHPGQDVADTCVDALPEGDVPLGRRAVGIEP